LAASWLATTKDAWKWISLAKLTALSWFEEPVKALRPQCRLQAVVVT
jgi:hypothetical protein